MFEMVRDGFGEKGVPVCRNLEEALEWFLAKDDA